MRRVADGVTWLWTLLALTPLALAVRHATTRSHGNRLRQHGHFDAADLIDPRPEEPTL